MAPPPGPVSGLLVPGPDADPAVLALYLLVGLVASLAAVGLLVVVGRIVYRLSKPTLTYLDRRLPVPVPTGATNRVLLTIAVLLVAGALGVVIVDAAAPYLWYGKPLPEVNLAGSGEPIELQYSGDGHLLGVADGEDGGDVDGDGLPDDWERAGETPDGVALPGADPRHKDLYVQVQRGATGRSLTEGERDALRRHWAELPVENPDGEPGIRLHLAAGPPGGAALDRLAVVTKPADVGRFYTRDRLGARRCVFRQVTLGQVAIDGAAVAAQVPGHAVVVDTGRRTLPGTVSWRVHAITHGLLHTIVGPVGEGAVHTESGWLAVAPGPGDDHLSPPAASLLSDRGFASPAAGPCSANRTAT